MTIAWMIEQVQKPTLIIERNRSLGGPVFLRDAGPLLEEPVEVFVWYDDYYQPETYLPCTDTYIEKDSSTNEIDRLQHAPTS
ncbi:MAG TPA: hypothetical protein VIX84_17225 [Acidimicrobiales bacterium]